MAHVDVAERTGGSPKSFAATRPPAPSSAIKLARRLKLNYVESGALTIKRLPHGRNFTYRDAKGRTIGDASLLQRLKSLAVPPAYTDVLYAEDERAHLQAVGRDAAGRQQYRYHPEWQRVREMRKAARLALLADALPRIRRSLGRHLGSGQPVREFTLSAVIDLVATSAIRAGSESYAKVRGTRGATTLLKSNVSVDGKLVTLSFKAKGGKQVLKEFSAPRLAEAIEVLRKVPGKRLFQFLAEDGAVRVVTAHDVNAFLREIADAQISLKDFRTLLASVSVLDALSRDPPADSKRGRRRQVLEAIRLAAEELSNTPAICAKSYVHESVVTAFEEGILERFAETLRNCRSSAKREQALVEVMQVAAAAT